MNTPKPLKINHLRQEILFTNRKVDLVNSFLRFILKAVHATDKYLSQEYHSVRKYMYDSPDAFPSALFCILGRGFGDDGNCSSVNSTK
jgi:hypothetical protein